MLYLEIFLLIVGITICFYIVFINIYKRFRFNLNKLLALIAFISIVQFSIILIQRLNIDIEFLPFIIRFRIFVGLILYFSQLMFHLIHIYPDKKVIPILWFFLLTGTPGLIFSIVTAATDLVIKDIKITRFYEIEFGDYFWVYVILFVYYQLAIGYVLLQKFRQAETSALIQDLIHFLTGFIFGSIFLFVFSYFLPVMIGFYDLFYLGMILSGILILLILNYGTYDFTNLDFKKFYFDLFSWVIIFLILFLPVFFVLNYMEHLKINDELSIASVSVLLLFYLMISINYFRLKASAIFLLNYNKLIRNFKSLFTFTEKISASEDLSLFWDSLFRNGFDILKGRYSIDNANLFIYNKKEKNYIFLYGFGGNVSSEVLRHDNPLISCFKHHPTVIEKSMLFSNMVFQDYKKEAVEFFNKYDIELGLPFINYEKEIFAFILLGGLPSFDTDYITGLPKKRIYTRTFIAAFEYYRLQFQRQLLHGMILEEIKDTQISEHDRIVVNTIKKRIIPKKIEPINGMRISCFNMNNSMMGGDYFDSIKFNNDTTCIFMSDLSYNGVNSALLGLELFSVFHTQVKYMNSSDAVMNIMNWIVSTARFAGTTANAYTLFYSSTGQISYCNGAYNPLLVYVPQEDRFVSLETGNVPIGADKEYIYQSETARLKPGSIGLLHSNGLQGALNSSGENYAMQRVEEIIRENRDETPSVIVRKVYVDLESHIKDLKQNNDISVIIFKVESVSE